MFLVQLEPLEHDPCYLATFEHLFSSLGDFVLHYLDLSPQLTVKYASKSICKLRIESLKVSAVAKLFHGGSVINFANPYKSIVGSSRRASNGFA
jgi:hypothetical protein